MKKSEVIVRMERLALILEGGGMRGIFTTGVLDCWLEHGLRLKTVYGVSAGACQACSYLCSQKGRSARIWIKYCGDKRFASFSSWLRTGDFFNADFNYRQIPDELEPIDNGAYLRDGGLLYAVVTNLRTGQAEYLPVRDMKADVACVQASSSLPLLSRPVIIHGQPYLDGGAADSVPLARSLRDGNTRHVIILTQPAGYRKQAGKTVRLIAWKYRKYPEFVETMRRRPTVYNETMDLVEREEQAGRALVIRPPRDPGVGRIEHDPAKLKALYDMGYGVAEERMKAVLDFCKADRP